MNQQIKKYRLKYLKKIDNRGCENKNFVDDGDKFFFIYNCIACIGCKNRHKNNNLLLINSEFFLFINS